MSGRPFSTEKLPVFAVFVALAASCGGASPSSPAGGAATSDAGAPPTATVVPFPAEDAGDGAAAGACAPLAPEPRPRAADAMDALRASNVALASGWRFAIDPDGTGAARGYAGASFDDAAWAPIDAGKSWEEQGFPAYDGVAWYRRRVAVPADWSGSTVRLRTLGVDDEVDVYVNGAFVRHLGERPDHSVWNRQTDVDVSAHLRPGQDNVLALRVTDWGGGGGLTRAVALRRALPLDPWRALLPEPVLDAHPEWVALAREAWRLAWEKIAFGDAHNGLAAVYMDEGFNEQIYQWDSSFMALFARYGARLFPAMASLDNFYARQRADGYIQRVYSETDGTAMGAPTREEPMVNPPLFAWIEWEYARFTGDASRLPRVLPLLDRYYGWLEANLRADEGRGLYYQTDLGSGMDNTPRGDVAFGGWIDMSAQQALAARHLARIARAVGDVERERRFTATFEDLRARIDALAWDEADGIYYDVTRGGARARVKHVGAFWPMLAGVADAPKAARLAAHLRDPREFWRPHPFPSLAASEPAYVPAGQYWRGGVWAPTNAMILRGLRATGARAIAREAAERHLAALAAVYASPPTDETRVAPEERDGAYATLWELYSPERPEPGTRWDGQYYGRQDFVGWTGLGPIAALFEDVLGIEVVGSESTLALDLARTDAHGVRRMPLGEGEVDVLVDPRPTPASPARVHVRATRPFVLEGRRDGAAPVRVDVCAGSSVVTLP